MSWQVFTLLAGFFSLLAAGLLYYRVVSEKCQSKEMLEYSDAIQKGARTYLYRLFLALLYMSGIVAMVLFVVLGWRQALTFILGSVCSAAAGYLGMSISVRANAKVAWAARKGLAKAFSVVFLGGAVMGLSVVGLALVGVVITYMVFKDPNLVLCFSFGASSFALLSKIGGGIFSKTADIGADLVGKIEFGLEEDDFRNPAVIADNVGDNVGDVAGTGADIFDSYVASIVAAMLLGLIIFKTDLKYVIYPLILGALGIFSSILGMVFVNSRKDKSPSRALNLGTIATAIIFAVVSFGVINCLDSENFWGIFGPAMVGLLSGIVVGFISDYFTNAKGKAVKDIAASAQSGPAILILNGFSYGLISVVPSVIGICLATVSSWFISIYFGIPGPYGVALAAVGMLSIAGMVVSADAYGPIADNARGCAESAREKREVIDVCDSLDEVGNTAKAITKGFAISAAALTVIALFSVYIQSVGLKEFDLRSLGVILGLFLGAVMSPLFSALTILSVGRNAFKMVEEVRRQFREIPGLLEGKAKPDSVRCVDIAASGALKELLAPGILTFAAPLVVGFLFGAATLGGFLAGSMVTGIIFALFMTNSGGLWDNAKKYIEEGFLGGKNSETHKASVIGDTVGDPFKDTAGPSINTLITVMSLCAIIFGGLIAKYSLFKL